MAATLHSPAVTARKRAHIATLRTATGLAVARVWDGMRYHGEDAQGDFARQAAPIVKAGQDRAVSLTVAAIALATGIAPKTDRAGILEGAAVDLTSPFKAFGHALNAGADVGDALQAGADTARTVGEDGVQWASRSAGAAFDHSDRVTGWARIPDANACDWCVLVAGQGYQTADSASFGHDNCQCDIEPLLAGEEA